MFLGALCSAASSNSQHEFADETFKEPYLSLTTPDDTYDADSGHEDDPRESRFWTRNARGLGLLIILAVPAFFRFHGRDFKPGHNQHP